MEVSRPITTKFTTWSRPKLLAISCLTWVGIAAITASASNAEAACPAIIGDIDGSGSANVVDVQCAILTTLWELNGGVGALPACVAGGTIAADVNCDNTINVSDVQITIQISLGQPLSAELDANQNKCPDACEAVVEPCGDGTCDPEIGETCVSCDADCGSCSGDCCAAHAEPGCVNLPCQDCVCAADPFCCNTVWDELCTGAAQTDCGADCGCEAAEPVCADVVNCALACDTQTCVDACFDPAFPIANALANELLFCLVDNGCLDTTTQEEFDICLATFCAIETDSCLANIPAQDCCTGGLLPGCVDTTCSDCVCALDPFCCEVGWDGLCVGESQLECSAECGCVGGTAQCLEVTNCVLGCADATCVDTCIESGDADAQYLSNLLLMCLIDNGCLDTTTQEEFDACVGTFCVNETSVCLDDGAVSTQDCCIGGPEAGCADPTCETCVCTLDPFCCDTSWDSVCVGEANLECNAECNCEGSGETTACVDTFNCVVSCLDGACVDQCYANAEPAAALLAETLVTCLVNNACFDALTPDDFDACLSLNCSAEADACAAPPVSQDCCVGGPNPGCNNAACEDCVCAFDPFCCDTSWDSICVEEASADCVDSCGCTAAVDCCTPSTAPGCVVALCETCVCTADPFCCDTAWDDLCVQAAETICVAECGCVANDLTCVETVNCALACTPEDTTCVDACFAQTSGQPLTDATTLFMCLVSAGCNTAITQEEFDACLAANCLAAAETCIGTVEPSQCCVAQTTPGCGDTTCEACVCGADAFCCDTSWDNLCVQAAETTCSAECGCVADDLTCVEAVNCGLACAAGDSTCLDACLAQTSGQPLTDATALLNCLIAAGCDATTTQEEFDACLAANCVAEADICLGTPVEPGDCCVAATAPGCNNATCEACVCALDAFCCDTSWDALCVDQATIDCAAECACAAPGDCCTAATTAGCSVAACETCVCALDAFCCDTAWDDICVDEAATACPTECGCQPSTGGECCVTATTPGCAVAACETCVCTLDAFCCETSWDEVCVGEAANECQADCGCDPGTNTGTNCVEVFNCFFGCTTQACADACLDAGATQSVDLFADLYFCLDDANCFNATTAAQFNQCLGFFCSSEADLCIADP